MAKRSLETVDFPPAKKVKISENRLFKESWKIGNSWLRYDSNVKAMYCDVCVKCQISNSFTTGCFVLKKESVTKHAKNKGNCL